MTDRLNEVYERLVRVTQTYQVEKTVESEAAVNVALDDARAELVSAEAARVGDHTVRLLQEQTFMSATILKVIHQKPAALTMKLETLPSSVH